MKQILFFTVPYLLCACSGNESTGNNEPEKDVAEQTTSYCDLPVVEEFFTLDDSVFAGVPVYDRVQIKDLICKGSRVVTENGSEVWDMFATYDNDQNILIDHTSGLSSIQFGIFDRAGTHAAMLLLMSDTLISTQYFEFDSTSFEWKPDTAFAHPSILEFFDPLTGEQETVIRKYGVYKTYLDVEANYVTYMLSDWGTEQNTLGTEYEKITPASAYVVYLRWDDEKFWLEREAM
jgi:hypothetical protein